MAYIGRTYRVTDGYYQPETPAGIPEVMRPTRTDEPLTAYGQPMSWDWGATMDWLGQKWEDYGPTLEQSRQPANSGTKAGESKLLVLGILAVVLFMVLR